MNNHFAVYMFLIGFHLNDRLRCKSESAQSVHGNEGDSVQISGRCKTDEFQCAKDSSCIDRKFHCDGVIHCIIDAEDEHNCQTCPPGYFACNDVGNTCIPVSSVCDGHPNCTVYGNDERGCVSSPATNIVCAQTNGRCNCREWNMHYPNGSQAVIHGLFCDETHEEKLVSFPIIRPAVKLLNFKGNELALLEDISKTTFSGYEEILHLDLENNSIKKLKAKVFKLLINLFQLVLARNKIKALQEYTFDGLKNLDLLDLSGNQISEITSTAFKGLKLLRSLNLTGNQIGYIEDHSFVQLVNLTGLYLRDNKIEYLTQQKFKGLKSLIVLDLGRNEMQSIANNTFAGLGHLKELRLDANKIPRLVSGMFRDLAVLEFLNLEGNQIKSVDRGVFLGLQNLRTLILSQNKISRLSTGIFENLVRLNELYLNDSEIVTVEYESFIGLKNLTLLCLGGNKIQSKITSQTFTGLKNLTKLSLYKSGIEVIDKNAFAEIDRLEIIELQDNEISTIAPETFRNLKYLKLLDLSGNKINLIENGTFEQLEHLETLSLGGNKIQSKITSQTFTGLKNLTKLSLYKSGIEVIDKNAFAEIDRLEIIELQDNEISTIAPETFKNSKYLKLLDLSGNKINLIENGTFEQLEHLETLYLCRNRISKLGLNSFKDLKNVTLISLRQNEIEEIENDSLFGLQRLRVLILGGNKISRLSSATFRELKNLVELYLEDNNIKIVEDDAFLGLDNLQQLNIFNNSIAWKNESIFAGSKRLQILGEGHEASKSYEKNWQRVTASFHRKNNRHKSLNNLEINSRETDEYRFCCHKGNYLKCSPKSHETSSCDKLLENAFLKFNIWTIGITAILANLFVIIFRTGYQCYYTNKVNSFLIKNLAISDTFMGLYVMIVAVSDYLYGEEFRFHDFEWRFSTWCHLASVMSTFSSTLSVSTLTVITIDRLLSITFPFRTLLSEIRQMRIVMLMLWIVAMIIACLPLPFFRIHYFEGFYSRSTICLPLQVTNKAQRQSYSLSVFVVLHIIALAVIVFSYICIYWSVRKTRQTVDPANRMSVSQLVMIFRMTLLVLGDAITKIPVITLGLRSIFGYPTSPDVYAWTLGFALPLNAALNPILYTISSLPITFRFFEYLHKRGIRSPMKIGVRLRVRLRVRLQFRSLFYREELAASKHLPMEETTSPAQNSDTNDTNCESTKS